MVHIRLAKEEELDLSMNLLIEARNYLHSYGNYQWDDNYPTRDLIKNDIEKHVGYLIFHNETPIGYFCGDFEGDPCYQDIRGQWLSNQPYLVVHRLGLGDAGRDKGLATSIFQAIETIALEHGVHSFRLDTDRRNLKMQHLLPKCGFTFCGYVVFAGDDKLAYEKLL